MLDIWASGTSRDPLTMHLVRSIFLSGATHHFTVLVCHIVGTDNSIAGAFPPFSVGAVPSTGPSSRIGTNTHSSLSPDSLVRRLAFLQSQAIADSTCLSYLAGIRRYFTFCTSVRWQSFHRHHLALFCSIPL